MVSVKCKENSEKWKWNLANQKDLALQSKTSLSSPSVSPAENAGSEGSVFTAGFASVGRLRVAGSCTGGERVLELVLADDDSLSCGRS